MVLDELKLFLGIIIGAASSGLPLWYKMRQMSLKLRSDEGKISSKERINAEAEWKRIIEFRDSELVRLRERDDQQERQLNDLWDKHIQCQRSEAAQGERIKANEERIKSLEERVLELLKVAVTNKPLLAPG